MAEETAPAESFTIGLNFQLRTSRKKKNERIKKGRAVAEKGNVDNQKKIARLCNAANYTGPIEIGHIFKRDLHETVCFFSVFLLDKVTYLQIPMDVYHNEG